MSETHVRTLTRSIIYRLTALTITAVMIGLNNAITIHVVLTFWHYIYERIWLKINWGKC